MRPGLRRDDEKVSPRSRERLRPRHRPGLAKAPVAGAVDQLSRAKRRIELRERTDLCRRDSLREMDRPDILGMFEACGCDQLRQRMQGGVMIIVNPFDLVRHHQRPSTAWILRGYAGR